MTASGAGGGGSARGGGSGNAGAGAAQEPPRTVYKVEDPRGMGMGMGMEMGRMGMLYREEMEGLGGRPMQRGGRWR